jgi:class 3 adenylate cyclase
VVTRGARLRRTDALLLASALAVFAACMALNVRELLRGGLVWMPVHVTPAEPGGFPRVRSFWSKELERTSGLARGDELLAVSGESLAGAGRLAFAARLLGAADGRRELPVTVRSGGVEREVVLPLPEVPFAWRTSLLALAFVLPGAFAFWRARGFPPARLLFGFAFGYGLHWAYFWGGSPAQTLAAIAAFALGPTLAAPFALRAMLSFPLETASASPLARFGPYAFALLGLGPVSWAFGIPLSSEAGLRLNLVGSILWAVTGLVILTANYVRAGPTGRRQIKWVLVGLYLAAAPPALAASAALLAPELAWLYEASLLSVICIPIALFVALGRDHLYDVDRLISASATYTLLSVLATAAIGVAVPRVARLLSGAGDPDLVQAGLSVGVAFALVGVRRWLGPRVQGLLFRERVALERGALAVREALAASEKPSELIETLGVKLDALLSPTCTVIYAAAAGDEFAPVFVRGPAAAPAFSLEKGLGLVLAAESGVVPVPARRRHPFWQSLGADEASALDAMGAALLVPLKPRGLCAGFVCLGDKRSGDVYTAQDRALLASIAEKTADELVRFHELERREAERQMNERLRRYVPGAIAEELERGGALAPGEREVTVLFVDVRGYSSFAEPLAPAQIFEAVSAYTRAVSEEIRAAKGTVVEFNGDGMMAVFGAPEALTDKEHAALRAALAIRRRVRALRFGPDARGLDVGIGVASGPAYVGSIQAVDRAIWSALGNTTNLAARLQGLTRDEGASVAVDEATIRGAGDAADAFRSIGIVPIRGRRPIEVFTLALDAPA